MCSCKYYALLTGSLCITTYHRNPTNCFYTYLCFFPLVDPCVNIITRDAFLSINIPLSYRVPCFKPYHRSPTNFFSADLSFSSLVHPCVNKTCPSLKQCVLNKDLEAECVCGTACSLIYKPVCGTNGKTYPNKCAMGIARCNSNESISLLHNGFCSKWSLFL